jgi:5'-methylthioadenosine phosphorylase
MSYDGPKAGIGVIGGSGFYSFFDGGAADPASVRTTSVEVETPFGPPSGPLTIGQVAGRSVAFLPRHGAGHTLPPHRVNYRANLWALRTVGVRQVLGPCAVGSLRRELGPGTLVVPDQVVDRTWGRAHTVYDEPGVVVHTAFADPYCPHGRAVAVEEATASGWDLAPTGTLVVINGPRFSTRAESQWHAAAGWSVVGMTGLPEASIARELALCYTGLALVTDHDAGVDAGGAVTHQEVLEVFAANVDRLKGLVRRVIEHLPEPDDDCACRHALDGLPLPFDLP